ncbi:MAG: YceI family protein [Flavobacteriales bacterium]|nr:YceI family protein [Flavobacteriales bacterium]
MLLLALSGIAQTDTFRIDKVLSKIEWFGTKVTGTNHGLIALRAGEVWIKEAQIIGGSFEMDMASITDTDLPKAYQPKLEEHLKSEDFFHVEVHPYSQFVIKNVAPIDRGKFDVQITGNLTIKGITREISFPAKFKASGSRFAAYGEMTIDRTQFDIRYGSTSFFDDWGDRSIENDFRLEISLAAKH